MFFFQKLQELKKIKNWTIYGRTFADEYLYQISLYLENEWVLSFLMSEIATSHAFPWGFLHFLLIFLRFGWLEKSLFHFFRVLETLTCVHVDTHTQYSHFGSFWPIDVGWLSHGTKSRRTRGYFDDSIKDTIYAFLS